MEESLNLEVINTEVKNVTEPVIEQVTEQVIEPVTEPLVEQVIEQVIEPVTEPLVEQVIEQVIERVTEQVIEPLAEPLVEQVTEPVTEQVIEQVIEPVTEPVVEQEPLTEQEPLVEEVTEQVTELDTTTSYNMCINKLIIKEKISYNILGMSGEIIFSGLGFAGPPCIYIVILLKTTGFYTFEIDNQIVSKQGSGLIEFYVIKNISIFSTNIYTIKYTSTEPLAIYELNLADRCMCHEIDCF